MEKRKERRQYKRYNVQCDVYCGEYMPRITREHMLKAHMQNISQAGALFECEKSFDIGELLILEVNLVGWQNFRQRRNQGAQDMGKTDCLRVNATVVRTVEFNPNKYHIGVQFSNIRAQDHEILKDYISKRILFQL